MMTYQTNERWQATKRQALRRTLKKRAEKWSHVLERDGSYSPPYWRAYPLYCGHRVGSYYIERQNKRKVVRLAQREAALFNDLEQEHPFSEFKDFRVNHGYVWDWFDAFRNRTDALAAFGNVE